MVFLKRSLFDIVSPLIVIYIKKWNDDRVVLYDDSEVSATEAEAFIFWNFVFLMRMTQQNRIFASLRENQTFVLERSSNLASAVHPPLQKLLENTDLKGLEFLFRQMLLLFKRDFRLPDVLRLWDSILTFPPPFVFPRLVAAAILVLLFPRFLTQTDGSLSDAIAATDIFLESADVRAIIRLAASIGDEVSLQRASNAGFIEDCIRPVPFNSRDLSYKPRYLKFAEIEE